MKRSTTAITILIIMLFMSAAVVFGAVNAGSKGNGTAGYFNSLNDFDWSRTCPAAGCRGDE